MRTFMRFLEEKGWLRKGYEFFAGRENPIADRIKKALLNFAENMKGTLYHVGMHGPHWFADKFRQFSWDGADKHAIEDALEKLEEWSNSSKLGAGYKMYGALVNLLHYADQSDVREALEDARMWLHGIDNRRMENL